MINKFQQGGTAQQQQMIQAFAQWGAKKFGKGQMSPEQFLQQFQQLDQKQQQQILQAFQQEQQGATMARLGSKLNYVRQLKGECPEGQELIYFKKGGRVCKQCMNKKEQGGSMSSNNPVSDFKKARMEKCGGKTKKKENGGQVDSKACGGKQLKPKAGCGKKMACGGKNK